MNLQALTTQELRDVGFEAIRSRDMALAEKCRDEALRRIEARGEKFVSTPEGRAMARAKFAELMK